MKRLLYHPGATRDQRESFAWYAQESPDTALRFLDAVENAYERIADHPSRFPRFSRNTRRLVLQAFPFSVIYRQLETDIQIIAVAHHKRRPGYWKNRIDSQE